MKKVSPFIVLIVSFLTFSCSDKKSENSRNEANTPTIHTLLFFDKTQSVDVNKPFVTKKYEQALISIIEQNIRKTGDQLEVYYIHENTAKSRCLSLTSRTEMENTEHMNATDKEAAQTSYDLSIRKERSFFEQQAMTRLKADNSDASNQETDIWASLSVIAKATEEKSIVKVYYFSDMIESVKGAGRRDFQINPPKTEEEAESWAKVDAEKLKTNVLNSPEITMILPFEPTSSRRENNPTVTQYWKKLFADLGVMNVNEL